MAHVYKALLLLSCLFQSLFAFNFNYDFVVSHNLKGRNRQSATGFSGPTLRQPVGESAASVSVSQVVDSAESLEQWNKRVQRIHAAKQSSLRSLGSLKAKDSASASSTNSIVLHAPPSVPAVESVRHFAPKFVSEPAQQASSIIESNLSQPTTKPAILTSHPLTPVVPTPTARSPIRNISVSSGRSAFTRRRQVNSTFKNSARTHVKPVTRSSTNSLIASASVSQPTNVFRSSANRRLSIPQNTRRASNIASRNPIRPITSATRASSRRQPAQRRAIPNTVNLSSRTISSTRTVSSTRTENQALRPSSTRRFRSTRNTLANLQTSASAHKPVVSSPTRLTNSVSSKKSQNIRRFGHAGYLTPRTGRTNQNSQNLDHTRSITHSVHRPLINSRRPPLHEPLNDQPQSLNIERRSESTANSQVVSLASAPKATLVQQPGCRGNRLGRRFGASMDQWCVSNCAAGNCPSLYCSCS